MLLLIDNYDSFTYNLVQYFGELGAECEVRRNDTLSCTEALDLKPDAIVLSPGPCTPNEAGICVDLVKTAATKKLPLLGVCLGHQSIGQAFGAEVVQCHEIVHGKISNILHDNSCPMQNLPSPFRATRYHSLVVDQKSLPNELIPTAWTHDGLMMAMKHQVLPIYGVQFHPESIETDHGHDILKKFLQVIENKHE